MNYIKIKQFIGIFAIVLIVVCGLFISLALNRPVNPSDSSAACIVAKPEFGNATFYPQDATTLNSYPVIIKATVGGNWGENCLDPDWSQLKYTIQVKESVGGACTTGSWIDIESRVFDDVGDNSGFGTTFGTSSDKGKTFCYRFLKNNRAKEIDSSGEEVSSISTFTIGNNATGVINPDSRPIQPITFNQIPNNSGAVNEGTPITNQFLAEYGITFQNGTVKNSNTACPEPNPIIATQGSPERGFEYNAELLPDTLRPAWATYGPNFLSNRLDQDSTACTLIILFEGSKPTTRFSFDILDIDYDEVWTISAFNSTDANTPIKTTTLDGRTNPLTLDGFPTHVSFELSEPITMIKIVPSGNKSDFGLGFDNFTPYWIESDVVIPANPVTPPVVPPVVPPVEVPEIPISSPQVVTTPVPNPTVPSETTTPTNESTPQPVTPATQISGDLLPATAIDSEYTSAFIGGLFVLIGIILSLRYIRKTL